jgi:NAD(P)-dependent dehydrogenase (short-subunit alcohol dehydrogenase family)
MNTPLFDLQGKKAAVTGAGRGFGRSMAFALAEAGADVAIADIDERSATVVADEIADTFHRQTVAMAVDVSDPLKVDAMGDAIMAAFERIDILVNNAGINIRRPIVELSPEEFDAVYNVNLKGVFLCSRRIAREMIKAKYGKIINIASAAALTIFQDLEMVPYYVTKAGVVQFTRAAAAEWASFGICVNAISPGWFITDINRHLWENPEFKQYRLDHTPMSRIGKTEDLSGTLLYLASSASDFVTGQNISVDGGFTIW